MIFCSAQPNASHGDGELSLLPRQVRKRAAYNAGQSFPAGGVELEEEVGDERGVSGAQNVYYFWESQATAEEDEL